jgi:benzil reductase ((S)-benzoin forming)
MKGIAIITGGSKGLGAALVQAYINQGIDVVNISRSPLGYSHPNLIEQISMDLSDVENIIPLLGPIISKILAGGIYDKFSLINNAAALGDIRPIKKYDGADTIRTIQLNLTAPTLLSALFINLTESHKGIKSILNITSGAAKRAIPSWANYCSTKAALDMLSSSLALENPDYKVASINPGIMDTEMQAHIRSASEKDFPWVGNFKDYHSKNHLVPAQTIARLILDLDLNQDFESGGIVQIEDRFDAPRKRN